MLSEPAGEFDAAVVDRSAIDDGTAIVFLSALLSVRKRKSPEGLMKFV
jgi:hypothetical protein